MRNLRACDDPIIQKEAGFVLITGPQKENPTPRVISRPLEMLHKCSHTKCLATRAAKQWNAPKNKVTQKHATEIPVQIVAKK